jgi:enoyl-CoA hydratase/carnithine racemase
LLYRESDGIAIATFNRPQARNALTFAMYERLGEICGALNARDDIRALIVTGTGDKAFAAGTDISQFRDFTDPDDGVRYEARIDRVLGAIESCRVPTIAAVAGACTGGGFAIAACCDLRIATGDARFGFPIARTLGNCLSMASLARLSSLLGAARLKEIVFTARLIAADEAQAIGLVHQVVADGTALAARSLALAQQIAGHAPLTLRATKEGLRRLQPVIDPQADADLIRMCYTSADFREGMEAFFAKRPPRWQGR